ncbi:MAG: Hdr-like menaquinol oxidoreductase cytochrome c subunit [Alphaproteobacteria bacterium]|nr:Hdr-like menaquinol oxidoreductase cytochrome c subunit [Alphaproteobacteria bacterium]
MALLAMLVAGLGWGPAFADPFPTIPKAKGERCVEDPQYMRRNHMDILRHQRDDTMRLGIRTTKHSLKECVSCHAVDGKDGKPVTVKSSQHFCSSCHEFAAVDIDCFACHASTPEAKR